MKLLIEDDTDSWLEQFSVNPPPVKCKTFLPYHGGRTRLLPILEENFPETIKTYWEPFVGGGSVYFKVGAPRCQKAVLIDSFKEMMITFQMVKDRLPDFLNTMYRHTDEYKKYGQDYWESVKKNDFSTDHLAVATRYYFLVLLAWNHNYFYRNGKLRCYHSKGRTLTKESIFKRVVAPSMLLQKAKVILGDALKTTKPKPGDFVYIDAPFHQSKEKFSEDLAPFDEEKHIVLNKKIKTWVESDVKILMNIASTDFMLDLYSDFKKIPVNLINKQTGKDEKAKRMIVKAGY